MCYITVTLGVGMGLRAVSLELLPLALVFRHAVNAPVLELDLAGENGLQIE